MDDKAFLKLLGENIKKIRKQNKISQRELALRCDFEKTTISRMESGRVNLTIITLKKVADGIGINVEDLMIKSI